MAWWAWRMRLYGRTRTGGPSFLRQWCLLVLLTEAAPPWADAHTRRTAREGPTPVISSDNCQQWPATVVLTLTWPTLLQICSHPLPLSLLALWIRSMACLLLPALLLRNLPVHASSSELSRLRPVDFLSGPFLHSFYPQGCISRKPSPASSLGTPAPSFLWRARGARVTSACDVLCLPMALTQSWSTIALC